MPETKGVRCGGGTLEGRHRGQSMPMASAVEMSLVTSAATHLAGPPLPEHTSSMAWCRMEGDAPATSKASTNEANTHRRSARCLQWKDMAAIIDSHNMNHIDVPHAFAVRTPVHQDAAKLHWWHTMQWSTAKADSGGATACVQSMKACPAFNVYLIRQDVCDEKNFHDVHGSRRAGPHAGRLRRQATC